MHSTSLPIKNVAAYCRVSTDKFEQSNSLENQQKYFKEYISKNPLWSLSSVYVDAGITGTSTKKRIEFNKMISDAYDKKFDLLLTKEISRFARNTLDSILYVRKLKELGIGVIFINDNINTLESDAELRLTIMASIAQEESRKTSERVKWGQKRQMEQGVVFGRSLLGYDVNNGKIAINETSAEIVKIIFHKFIEEGKGSYTIARELRESGIPTYNYMKSWSSTSILRILKNEKYIGNLIQKKTFTPNYLTHQKKCNKGEEDYVTIENHHEAIIDKDIFNSAQVELNKRRKTSDNSSRYSSKHLFSGKIKCGYCSHSFISKTKTRKDNSIYKAWHCYEATKNGTLHDDKDGKEIGCQGRQINNDILISVMSELTKALPIDKVAILTELTNLVNKVFILENPKANSYNADIDKLICQRQKLIELYLNNEIDECDYTQIKNKIDNSLKMLKKSATDFEDRNLTGEKLDIITDIIIKITEGILYDEIFYRGMLDKIIVYDRSTMELYLNHVNDKIDIRLLY